MKKRIRTFLRRSVKQAAITIKKLRAAWRHMEPKKRLVTLGCGAGAVIALTALIIVLSTSGKAAEDTPALAGLDGQSVLLAGAQPSPDEVLEITPSPTPTLIPTPTPVPTPTPTPDPTLRRGMESEEVRELQIRLIEIGYLELDEPTMKYGPATEGAVERFQRQVNFTEELDTTLVLDGVAGVQTLELIYSDNAPKYCVVYGMEGEDITDMQDQLKDLGYMSVVTGYYGETTVDALKDFQDRNGLSPDGMCGEKTFSLLYSDSARESASKAHAARTKANIDKMISVAKEQLGDPYVRGAKGPSSFDCSGLVYYCLKEGGSNRRRLNAAGYSGVSDWEKITNINNLKKGDLIFFYSDDFSKVGHVGIVINNSGEMIDASSSNGKVVRREYLTNYWKKHFVCGRRPW